MVKFVKNTITDYRLGSGKFETVSNSEIIMARARFKVSAYMKMLSVE